MQIDVNRINLDDVLNYDCSIGPYWGHKGEQGTHHDFLNWIIGCVVLKSRIQTKLFNVVKIVFDDVLSIDS